MQATDRPSVSSGPIQKEWERKFRMNMRQLRVREIDVLLVWRDIELKIGC